MTPFARFLRANALWLGAGVLLTFLSSFGQTFFISIFAGQIRAEFGLSHGGWGAIYAAATMLSAAVMVAAGGLTDRLRVRVLGPAVILGLALSVLGLALAQGVWALALAVFGLRLFGQGMMGHTAMVAMSRWFVATRGRAIAIAGLGYALGEALLPMVFVGLMSLADWRALWLGIAVGLAALSPVLFLALRHERTPRSFAQAATGVGMQGRSWTRAEALRAPFFWLMVPSILGPSAWGTAFFFHQVHIAEVKGWGHAALVAMFPVFTVCAVVFMQIAGWIVDRLGSARLMPVFMLPAAAGFAVFALAPSPWWGVAGMALMGASVGMNATLGTALWAEAFGTRHLGAIRAMTTAGMVLGSAIGPGLTGALIDAGIDFPRQGWGIAAYFVLSSALAARAARRLRAGAVSGDGW